VKGAVMIGQLASDTQHNRKTKLNSSFKKRDRALGMLLVMPAILLISAVIIYPLLFNIYLSFFEPSLNPAREDKFIGFGNYIRLLSDLDFYQSLLLTFLYVLITVSASTVVGLIAALMMNRAFLGRKLARALLLLPYVTPVISSVFIWTYMFNGLYGVMNYLLVDLLSVFDVAPLWFDNPVVSLLLVSMFDVWRIFPFALIMLLSALQAIDSDIYEAAAIDGAKPFRVIISLTIPSIVPVLVSVVSLRAIWNFYKFEDVFLLTRQVQIIGVYLYRVAFASHDLGLASAISMVLFVIVITMIFVLSRRKAHD
jgi:multiple sugar transport system permease protein